MLKKEPIDCTGERCSDHPFDRAITTCDVCEHFLCRACVMKNHTSTEEFEEQSGIGQPLTPDKKIAGDYGMAERSKEKIQKNTDEPVKKPTRKERRRAKRIAAQPKYCIQCALYRAGVRHSPRPHNQRIIYTRHRGTRKRILLALPTDDRSFDDIDLDLPDGSDNSLEAQRYRHSLNNEILGDVIERSVKSINRYAEEPTRTRNRSSKTSSSLSELQKTKNEEDFWNS